MDADGGNQRRITNTDTRELAPRFLPNGDLAWVVERGARAGSAILRQTGPASVTTLVSAPAAILSWSLSRDGATIAYVTGRITSATDRAAFSLVLQPVAGGSAVPVRLGPAEQPVTPAF
jgi:Lipoprotein LpqB beta-propeller domain.